MGDPKGFLKIKRQEAGYRPVEERVNDYLEVERNLPDDARRQQASRCMDCGVPFCHWACPVSNIMPEWQDLIYRGDWKAAYDNLQETNNFPEFTGRVCPAPCEAACTLSVNDDPVLIRHIELQIVERGFQEGWIRAQPPAAPSGKHVAVIGSGPAGLAAAQQLARAGHRVLVIEQDERPGGMLRYGIPDFKLEKWVIDRRLEQLSQEGVEFQNGVVAGEDISARYLQRRFDGVFLAMGARQPRELDVPGRDLDNVLFALDYLAGQNRACEVQGSNDDGFVSAKGKTVVVIGGGDTGSDCVGTARRQGAKAIYQLEILPRPPERRPPDTPWPTWPRIMRTSTSHEEGCERRWSVLTKRLGGTDVHVTALYGIEVDWVQGPRGWQIQERPGTEFVIETDLVLVAMGFVHVQHRGLVDQLGLRLDDRGNVWADRGRTSVPWVFAAGDSVRGASLVVRAVASGREAAAAMNEWLR